MKQRLAPLTILAAAVCLFSVVEHASGQSTQTHDALPNGAVLSKLFDPTYPRLAQQAHITGDVDLMLSIRRDGSVESAVVVSGHPILKQAALDSAQQSQFDCGGCVETASYALKYKFQITSRGYPNDCDTTEKQPPAEVDDLRHQVTVSAWGVEICDPAGRIVKVRSTKCLYLWRCGTRDED
jgi:TonB family protein